jgi:hypothetical protein
MNGSDNWPWFPGVAGETLLEEATLKLGLSGS